jgi:CubicO group peptidase (beta-lactamase class C family)
MRAMGIVGRVMALVIVLGLVYVAAGIIANGPVTTYRMITSGDSNIYTFKIFPQRPVVAGGSVSVLDQGPQASLPGTISFFFAGSQYTANMPDVLARTGTQAFIIVQDDRVIYESYMNGASRDTVFNSFSMAKSFTSALVGVAVDEGKINSIDDPLIKYVPELQGRGFDNLTLREMLRMSTGIQFKQDADVPVILHAFQDDDSRQYYTENLQQLLFNVQRSEEPVGAAFRYNDYYALLEGLILDRVTGDTVAQYTQDKLWQPMGMEYQAAWGLDSTADGLEKTNTALNARAIDFARIGLMYLHNGRWNGQQIVSQDWVTQSTTRDPTDQRVWLNSAWWAQNGGYYKYHWWGLTNPDGTYDYMAFGKDGQWLYVSPSTNTVVLRLGEGEQFYPWPFAIRALIRSLV